MSSQPTTSPPNPASPTTTSPHARSDIPHWGADLDHANRPAYPRERMPARLPGLHWTEPEQQKPTVEVLHSTERPGITPIFGTGQPPSGISGSIRRIAFKYSENDIRHWLLLLAADRVNVGEGLLQDLSKGHIPNFYKEMGGRAERIHNPEGFARKAGLVAAATVGIVYLIQRKRRERR